MVAWVCGIPMQGNAWDAAMLMDDIYVVSDLHMGRGKNPQTRRFFALEAFFYDADFSHFCDYLCRQANARRQAFKLVLNGDVFDLLRIEPDPDQQLSTPRERRFGPVHTPAQAAKTVGYILEGHPGFVRGLAQILYAGHDVIFLPGNHDIEVQWKPVQDEIRRTVRQYLHSAYGDAAQEAGQRLRFEPWFYYEPGRIWIEHGCQYDPENSFQYLLRGDLADAPEHVHAMEQDLPLGNFFQRYLYNAFGHITFIVPTTRSNVRYVKWLLFNEPKLLARVILSHGPFAFQVLRRLAQVDTSAREALQQSHERLLTSLTARSQLGGQLLAIDQLKEVRADAVQAVHSLVWQLLKGVGGGVLFALLTSGLWFLGFHSINHLRLGFVFKAFLFLCMDLLTAGITTAGIVYTLLSQSPSISPRPLRRAAQRIATLLDVPLVTFGHTHDEELWQLKRPSGGQAWYCNTGTWIAVFTHDVLIPRERVQYTFLHIHQDKAELLYWSPGRGEPMPVILLDEGETQGVP